MKNKFESDVLKRRSLLAILAITLVFTMAACGNGTTGGGTAPAITTVSLPNGTVGMAYSQTLSATGDTPITWSLESGALPTGLNLLGSGVISGTPTTAGTFNYTVKATNSAGSSTKLLSITITTSGSGVAKTIVITGVPTTYQYGAIALYPVGTTVEDVADETVDPVAASGVGMPGASISTYPLYGLDGNPWTGSGSYAVYWVLKTSSNSSEEKLYRASSVSFTAATTTVAFSQFTEITGGTPNLSLDGTWDNGGLRVTVSGSTGVFSAFDAQLTVRWQDALNKGYISVGSQFWRNLTSTGNLTWSGQELGVTYNTSNPNVSTGTRWLNETLTMSADGQTLTSSGGSIWTRVSTYSLDGIWDNGGLRVTVSGSTGVFSAFDAQLTVRWQDALNKGYISVGSQFWRNLTSTGNLTWSGQELGVTYNTSNPNVSTGTRWLNETLTMSADGQTVTSSGGSTWTRQ